MATAAGTTEALIAAGAEDLWPGRRFWAVTVLGIAGGVAAAVTRRVPVSLAYPAAVVCGLVGAVVRSLPGEREPAAAAALAAAAVAAAARPARLRRGGGRRSAPPGRPATG